MTFKDFHRYNFAFKTNQTPSIDLTKTHHVIVKYTVAGNFTSCLNDSILGKLIWWLKHLIFKLTKSQPLIVKNTVDGNFTSCGNGSIFKKLICRWDVQKTCYRVASIKRRLQLNNIFSKTFRVDILLRFSNFGE